MIIASKILSDIEELHKLKQKGTISQDEYKLTVCRMLRALSDADISLYCLEPVQKLYQSGALTKAEFETLKSKVLADTVSSTQDSHNKISNNVRTNKDLLHGVVVVFTFMAKVVLFILRIPLVILNVVLGWKIQEDIIAEGVKKGMKK
ncbi:MAG: SHOCT domain-containing protein [Alphaproteobacteria bacterium]|nr:SHOCT domain-containing protein [Alphaproteobacteria bacterium]